MIPKIIHYCWFGGNPLPESALKCIDSWRKFFPDYEIRQWNETNFDVNAIPYTAEAYAKKKYAFVSDYARFVILYRHGGLYFDTDVEVIKPFDEILSSGAFMGRETGAHGQVNPGLGLGVEAGNAIYKEVIDHYATLHFIDDKGEQIPGTVVLHTTLVLRCHGLVDTEAYIQDVEGIKIYPCEYFCPMDSTTGVLRVTPKTFSIHWYDCSWMDHNTLRFRLHLMKNAFNRMLAKLGLM